MAGKRKGNADRKKEKARWDRSMETGGREMSREICGGTTVRTGKKERKGNVWEKSEDQSRQKDEERKAEKRERQ